MSSIDRFDEGLAEVRSLMGLDPSSVKDLPVHEEERSGSGKEELGVTVRRAAVVLLVSHFEGFLKQICEDLMDSLNDGSVVSKKIPKGVRELHILPRFQEIINSGSEQQRFALLAKMSDISGLWNDSAKPPKGTLRSDLIVRQVHNADSECIDKIFDIFGLREAVCDGEIDVTDEMADAEETHDIRTRLRDLVKCRNDIAHGDMERRPTDSDVNRYILFLSALSRRLHRKSEKLTLEFLA